MTHLSRHFGLAVLAMALTMPTESPALAANGTWNGGAGATWDTSTANWLSLTGTPWNSTNGGTNAAIFNTAGATPSVSGTVWANGLTFANTGTISNGTITLAGSSPTLTTNAGVSAQIASQLSGSVGLGTGGGGTLTLSGSSALSGTATFGAGEVILASGAALPSLTGLTVGESASSATLRVQSGAALTAAITNGVAVVGSNLRTSGTVIQEGGIVTLSGATGALFLSTNGSATTYTGSASYVLQGGTLALTDTTSGFINIGRNAPATFTQSGGVVTLARTNDALTIGDYSTGSYAISGGSLTATSTAANSILGSRGGAGTLTVSGSASIGLGGSMFLAVNGQNSVSDKGSATINLQGGTLAVNGMTRGRTGVTGTSGAGTATFNFSGGTLRPYNANTAIGSSTAANNFTIDLSGTGATLSGIDLAGSFARRLDVYATLQGTGNLTVAGGTVALRGANTFSGTTTVNGGMLLLSNTNALRDSTFAGGAGTLAFTQVSSISTFNYYYLGGLSGSSTLSLLDTSGTSIRLNFGFNNADTTFSGNLTNGEFIEKFGTGTTTLSGNISTANTTGNNGALYVYLGGIRQTGGTITLNRDNGTATFTAGSGSAATGSYILESGTIVTTQAAGHMRIGQSGATGILTINGSSARAFFSGTNNTIGGNDLASTSGTGTINLMAGELAVNSLTTGTAAGSTGSFNFSGGTLRPYSQNTTIGRSGSGFTIALAGTSATFSGIDAAGTARTLTIATALVNGTSGAAGAIFAGGTVALQGVNTFSGTTTIRQGTLALASGGSFASSPRIIVGDAGSSGAVLDLTAKTGTFAFTGSQTVGGIGTIRMDAGDTVQFAGTFAPGNSPGIFTFDGGTALLSGSTQIEIFGATRGTGYDAIDLINNAALDYGNGVLALDFGSWLADQQSYQLFGSGSSTLLGDFASVTIAGTNYTGLTFTGSNGVWTSQGTSPAGQTLTFTEATGVLVIVPEPGAIALAGLGISLAGWATARRRRLPS